MDHNLAVRHVGSVIATLLHNDCRRATKYVSPSLVAVAHRIVPGGKRDRRDKSISLHVKLGPPNYHERQFIADAKKAGTPFPVKRIQLAEFRKVRKLTPWQERFAARH